MDEFICKTVIKNGIDFGESIDIHDGNLIVKSGPEFVAVPLTVIERIEPDKIYIADFNIKRGKFLGDRWIESAPKSPTIKRVKNLFRKTSTSTENSNNKSPLSSFPSGEDSSDTETSCEKSIGGDIEINSFLSKLNRTQELRNNLDGILTYVRAYRKFLEDNFVKKQDELINRLVKETLNDLECKLEEAKARLTIINFFLKEFDQ